MRGLTRAARLFSIALLTIFVAAACKFEGGVFNPNSGGSSVGGDDFRKSFFLGDPQGLADGLTELDVVLFFVHTSGKPAVGFTPNFSASMFGLTGLGCSVTDGSGRSVCRFTSTRGGTFVMKITNVSKALEKSFTFVQTASGSIRGFASSGNQKLTGPGGWTAQGSLGSPTSGAILTGAGGWKAFIDVQPSISTQ